MFNLFIEGVTLVKEIWPVNHGPLLVDDDVYEALNLSERRLTVVPRAHYWVLIRNFLFPERLEGYEIDHINRNPMDCRAENLRQVPRHVNQFNKESSSVAFSRYKGVQTNAKTYKGRRQVSTNPWRAGIQLNGKRIHLGCFATEVEAAKAYDKKAFELFGPDAFLNFPEDFASVCK